MATKRKASPAKKAGKKSMNMGGTPPRKNERKKMPAGPVTEIEEEEADAAESQEEDLEAEGAESEEEDEEGEDSSRDEDEDHEGEPPHRLGGSQAVDGQMGQRRLP